MASNTIYKIQFFNNTKWIDSVFFVDNEEEAKKKVEFLNESLVKYRYILLNQDK